MEKTVFGSYYAASTAPGAAPLPLPAPQSTARAPLLAGGSPRQPLRLSAAICSTDYYPAAAPSLAPWHSSPSPAAGSVFRYGTPLDPLPTAAVGASLRAAPVDAFRLVGCDSTVSVSVSQTHSPTRTFVTDSVTADYFTVTVSETCTAAEVPTGTASMSNESQSEFIRRVNATMTAKTKSRSRGRRRPPRGKGVPFVDYPFVFKSNNNSRMP